MIKKNIGSKNQTVLDFDYNQFKDAKYIDILSVDPSYTNFGYTLVRWHFKEQKIQVLKNHTITFPSSFKKEFFKGIDVNLKVDKVSQVHYNNYRLGVFTSALNLLYDKASVHLTEAQPHKNINEPKTILQIINGLNYSQQYAPNQYYEEFYPVNWKKLAFGQHDATKNQIQRYVREFMSKHMNQDDYIRLTQHLMVDEHQYDSLGITIAFLNKYYINQINKQKRSK